MTSSQTREVDPDMLSAVLADHDERRPCPTPCRDQSERGGCLCAITAATLRALADERDAARAEAARLTAEVASLRLTLGGKTFSASVPEPVGCPMPGACATVAEIVRAREMQAAWMRVIQAENTCGVTGKPCDAVRCGCSAEQEMLIREAADARAALAAAPEAPGRGDKP